VFKSENDNTEANSLVLYLYERLKMLRPVFVYWRRQGTALTKSVSTSCHSQKWGTYAEHTVTRTCTPELLANGWWSNACTITYTHKHAHVQ